MGWARDSTSGILTHAGTVREVWRATQSLFTKTEIKVGFRDIAHNIKVAIRMSGDTRTRFALGIEGANLVIQRWTFGVLISTVATAAHMIGGSTPGTLRVRLQGDSIECSAITASTATATVSTSTTDLRGSQRWGIESDANGAAATFVSVAELTDRVSTVTDVATSIIGGAVYASYASGSWELIQAGVFDAGAFVSAAVLNGKVWMIGGGRARVFDPVTRLVTNYVPTSGTLPGQTAGGTTTARFIKEHQGCLFLCGMPEAPLLIYKTKIGDALNLNSGERLFGSAKVYGVGDNATVPDPIVGVHEGPDDTLCFACTNSVNFLVGDTNAGSDRIITKSDTTGGSGPRCMVKAYTRYGDEIIVMHGPEGHHVVPVGGAPAPLSSPILRKYIEYPRELRNLRTVVLARDPERALLHAFIDDGTTGSTHVTYAERVGRYAPGAPGFYPIRLPVRITCQAIIRGVLHLGTEDGRLVSFDRDAATDLGANLTSKAAMALVDAREDVEDDTIVSRLQGVFSSASANVTATLYGAVTAEAAFTGTRRTLASRTLGPGLGARPLLARAPYIVMEVDYSGTGKVSFERVQIEHETAMLSRWGSWVDAAAPGASCQYPTASAPAPSPPGGGGPGTRPDTPPPPPPPPPPRGPTFRKFVGPTIDIDIYIRSGSGNGDDMDLFEAPLDGVVGDAFEIQDELVLLGVNLPLEPKPTPFNNDNVDPPAVDVTPIPEPSRSPVGTGV